jgi:hypothetical protein
MYGRFVEGKCVEPDKTTIASAGSWGNAVSPSYHTSSGRAASHAKKFMDSAIVPTMLTVSSTGRLPLTERRHALISP